MCYSADGNRLEKTTDALGKETAYSYNADTNVLDWVQYPEDTEETRTEYTYDSMYRMATAACETDTNLALFAAYTYEDDRLTAITTPTTAYHFDYGKFGLRTEVSIGDQTLASYSYTNDRNNYLSSLDYGNGDRVHYTYDDEGRIVSQTYEDGESVSWKYDESGFWTEMTDSATGITTTYTYDLEGRLRLYEEKGVDHDYSLKYSYTDNKLTYVLELIDGYDRGTRYTYDDNDRLESVRKAYTQRDYTYDGLNRVTSAVTSHKDEPVLTTNYTFADTETTAVAQVAAVQNTTNGADTPYGKTYSYTYDDNGNILSVSDGTKTTSYVYDSANQLIRENNEAGNFTYTWQYDNAGNILSKKVYAYTTGELGTPTDTITYSYGDSNWGDLLTAYDGNNITYDAIGNPLTDGTWTYDWQHGRQLASMTGGDTTWSYTYNADGMRTSRTDGTTTYSYVYNGSQLSLMTVGNDTLKFTYDANGTPLTVTYNGTLYYYITNIQGDVVTIINTSRAQVVNYTYDVWGNVLSITGSMADTLGQMNPLRYRGYVYDTETGLYYLQSRYYNPEMGRFVNADGLISTGQGLLGSNMVVYCGNNPVLYIDSRGTRHEISAGSCGGFSTSSAKDYNQNSVLGKTVQVISTVLSNVDVGVSLGLGMSGNIDTFDMVDLEVGIRYDLISIGYKNGQFYCQQEYFTGIDGTVLVVFDYNFHAENKVRKNPFSKDFGSWEEDRSNDIWTIFGNGLYFVGGARYHIGLDILSLIEDIESIF